MSDAQGPSEMQMDADNLYLQETFTDQKVGTIVRLTPVTPDGEPDPGRPVQYIGQAQIMTPMGAVPLTFSLPGTTLSEAVAGFAGEAAKAVERTIEEAREMQREAAGSIVVPGQSSSKIQIP
ncbi:MAG: hypothetical protein ACTSXZ_09140 [Alphaproteobacteria bacterium]